MSPVTLVRPSHRQRLACLRHPRPYKGVIFVDDRLLWAPPGARDVEAALADGLTRSNFFDNVMNFTCRPSKCAIVEPQARPQLHALAAQLGYPTRHHLEILGLTVELDSGKTGLLKLSGNTLQSRLRALNILNPPFHIARAVCSSLVFAALAWAAGIAAPEAKDLTAVRKSIHRALKPQITGETPWVLLAEVHGWQWDPKWLLQWRALRAVWRNIKSGAYSGSSVQAVLPHADSTITDLGWQLELNGAAISRVDDAGQTRRFWFGWQNIHVLRDWLIEERRKRGIASCGRVKTSYHRGTVGLATGLNLDAPCPSTRFALSGHRLLGHSPSLDIRRASLATGGSSWYHRQRIPTQHASEVKCLCNLLWPSRPHITWVCPKTDIHRHGLQTPTNRVEERLFGAPLPEYPAAPADNQVPGMVQALRDHLYHVLAQDADNLLVATDGSHQNGVGACAVVTESPSGTFSAGDNAEDQSPFRFEMVALHALLQALPRGQPYRNSTVTILVDCQSALDSIQHPDTSKLKYLAEQASFVAGTSSGL